MNNLKSAPRNETTIACTFTALAGSSFLWAIVSVLFVATAVWADDTPKKSEPPAEAKPDKKEDFNGDQDALVKQFPQWKDALKLKGDAIAGKTFYETKTFKTVMTCASCHSFNPADTFTLDGDGEIRSGNPIYGAVHRTNIKNSASSLAVLGGNVCVLHFMKGAEPGMTAQEMADLNAFLQTGGKADHSTSKNLDYKAMRRTVPENLRGGDPVRGKRLASEQYCISCHTVEKKKYAHVAGSRKLAGSTIAEDKIKDLALRIRNPDFKINDEMPGHDDTRMPEKDLLDIIAWLKEGK